jgi:hypothetical protein
MYLPRSREWYRCLGREQLPSRCSATSDDEYTDRRLTLNEVTMIEASRETINDKIESVAMIISSSYVGFHCEELGAAVIAILLIFSFTLL